MHDEPRQPRDGPAQFQFSNLRDGGRAPDRRHRALVEIGEQLPRMRLRGISRDPQLVLNDFCRMRAHLDRPLRDTRHQDSVAIDERGEISHGKHFGMTRDAQVGQNRDAPRAIRGSAEHFREWTRAHSRGPDDVRGANNFVADHNLAFADRTHARVGPHLHTEFFELALRTLRKLGRKRFQDTRASIDEEHARLRRVDVVEVAVQHGARELGEISREFHARRSAAYDDDTHQIDAALDIGLRLRLLERAQDLAANAERIVERLQSRRELFPLGVPEITRGSTRSHDEIVVVDRPARMRHAPRREIDPGDLGHDHGKIIAVRKHCADRLRDIDGRQPRGGDLVEQRLKKMVVLPVDQRHGRFLGRNPVDHLHAGEAGADHDHARQIP